MRFLPIPNKNTEKMESKTTKRCASCGNELPLSEFSDNRHYKDGKMPCCKECHRKNAKKGGKGKRCSAPDPVIEQPAVQQTPPQQVSPQVMAEKALGKVFGAEQIGIWMEVNKAYEMFLKYFRE